MNIKETRINTRVKEEVKHIRKGPSCSPQSWLREHYAVLRQRNYKTSTKSETYKQAVDIVKKDHPDFIPKCDPPDYF
jgi:hypothetical protein